MQQFLPLREQVILDLLTIALLCMHRNAVLNMMRTRVQARESALAAAASATAAAAAAEAAAAAAAASAEERHDQNVAILVAERAALQGNYDTSQA